jgi:hypothetical protein
MSNHRDLLRAQLVTAGDRLLEAEAAPARPAPRRRWRRSPRVLAVAFAVVATSATALAATTPWRPLFGEPGSPQPEIAADAPPANQLATLGVLRRAQTDADRGPVTERALRSFGTSTEGVHTGSIRRLPAGDGGLAAVLVPARTWDMPELHKTDVACLFVAEADAAQGGAKACFTTDEVRQGFAGGSLGRVVYGLVPDGVAQVELRYRSQTVRTAVADNFYELLAPRRDASGGGSTPDRLEQAVWLDGDGKPAAAQPTEP